VHSNAYTFRFAAIVTIVCSVLLAGAATLLKPRQLENEKLDKKKNVLISVGIKPQDGDSYTRKEIQEAYAKKIREYVINKDGEFVEGKKPADADASNGNQELPKSVYDKKEIINKVGVQNYGEIVREDLDWESHGAHNFSEALETPAIEVGIENIPEKIIVKSGDSVWKISENWLEDSGRLNGLNKDQRTYMIDFLKDRLVKGMKNPNLIHPGDRIDFAGKFNVDDLDKARSVLMGN